jgi:hypothetical protein
VVIVAAEYVVSLMLGLVTFGAKSLWNDET